MIWTWFLIAFVSILNGIVSWIPHVDTIPFGIDDALITLFGYWHGFLAVMWPLEIVWTCVLFYYGIKLILLGLKFIPWLGTRVQV